MRLDAIQKGYGGHFAENVMYFGRMLRAAGLPIGPGRILDALEALRLAGISRRDDVYWTLHAVFIDRFEHREIFDQAFRLFWRDPRILDQVLHNLPSVSGPAAELNRAPPRRLAPKARKGDKIVKQQRETATEIDASLSYSVNEGLEYKDFESMTADEVAQAKAAMGRLTLDLPPVPTRRFTARNRGVIDLRATMRASMRSADAIPLRYRVPRQRPPRLVVLCDVSRSMSRYSRMFLHFVHALTNSSDRVDTFLFGTRLTNVTRYLRHRDVDKALEEIGHTVQDWDGGPVSEPAWRRSTGAGRGACLGRAPWCSCSPTGWTGPARRAWPRRPSVCRSHAGV